MSGSSNDLRMCQCGCGLPTVTQRPNVRFRPGHGRKGASFTPEHKQRIAEAAKKAWAGKKVPGHKACSRCKALKEQSQFGYRKRGNFLRSMCRECERVVLRELRVNLPPEKKAESGYRARIYVDHGIRHEDYVAVLAKQGGGCAICGRSDSGGAKSTRLHIDHCHATSEIRGLLCTACNTGLGRFFDQPALLRRAADYLETSRTGLTHSPRRGLRGGLTKSGYKHAKDRAAEFVAVAEEDEPC